VGNGLTSIGSFLDSVTSGRLGEEEGVIRQAEEQRCLLLDLPYGVLNRRCVGVGHRIKVERDDRDAVGELLCQVAISTGS